MNAIKLLFIKPVIRIFAWLIACASTFMLLLMAWHVLFTAINRYLIPREVHAEIPSPSGNAVLTIIDEHGFMDGWTIFHLRHKNESMEYPKKSLISGKDIQPRGDILVVDSGLYPYGITWNDEHHLIIRLRHPIGWKYTHNTGEQTDPIIQMKKSWADIEIEYGALNSDHSNPHETIIDADVRRKN